MVNLINIIDFLLEYFSIDLGKQKSGLSLTMVGRTGQIFAWLISNAGYCHSNGPRQIVCRSGQVHGMRRMRIEMT
jgi:hypothetical protein